MDSSRAAHHDRQIIDDALGRADRRRRLARAIAEGLVALSAGLALLVVLALWRLAAPVPSLLWWTGGVLPVVLPFVAAARQWLSRPRPDYAGAALDRAAGLPDEMTSAGWFLQSGRESAWIDVAVARAAASAERLDVEALLPIAPPRAHVTRAAALAAAFIVALIVPVSWSRPMVAGTLGTGLTEEGSLAALGDDEVDEPRSGPESGQMLVPGGQPSNGQAEPAQAGEEMGDPAEGDGTESTEGAADAAAATGQPGEGSQGQTSGEQAGGSRRDGAMPGGDRADASPSSGEDRSGQEDAGDDPLQQALDRAAEEAIRTGSGAPPDEARQTEQGEAERDSAEAPREGDGAAGGQSAAGAGEGQTGRPTENQGGEGSNPGGGLGGRQAAGEDAAPDGEATSLDVTLKREQLLSALDSASLEAAQRREQATERGAAGRSFQAVRPQTTALPAGAQAGEGVPWAYQALVRQYFIDRAARPEQKDRQ